MYNISDYQFSAGKGSFDFNAGGWQDARGSDNAGDFYVEGILEELDQPGEWFYDSTTGDLLVYWNATSGTPPDASVIAIAASASVLVNASSSMASPIQNLSFLGLGFRDTAYTYFSPHSMPSAGDWALARTAALFFEGTEGVTISGCTLERLDGSAIMFSGYTRGANVSHNELAWIGETGIALWGYTNGDPWGVDGPMGVDGNQPRGNYVGFNYAHDLGIWEKQSSLFFQAKSSDTMIEANIFFNGPRAGINFNVRVCHSLSPPAQISAPTHFFNILFHLPS